ncbi:uncharacterized protein LOC119786342 [Cyprinodon tularosa]|uniref:uncharacterized protein LOC119786342 n=1 Tax=Cyprinodon tularosa TaxID=77115 RepID=UPI0018E2584A|nr:uncharacterized protein LOC119786342 [Cyprinodon tularosa]
MLWSLVFIWVITTQYVAVQTTDLCNKRSINLMVKKASQSSTFDSIHDDGEHIILSRAFDEDPDTCCVTENQTNSWWRIELQGIYNISCISIYTNPNYVAYISGAQIYIGNSLENNGTNNRLVYNITADKGQEINYKKFYMTVFSFTTSALGRYVTVFRPGQNHLVLCEVNISGTEIKSPFKLINISKTWEDSRSYCRANHTDLASIRDEQLQVFAEIEAEKANSPFAWIGLRYVCSKQFWFWVDRCTIDYEDCGIRGAMKTQGEHKWFERSDYEKFNFICAL